MNDLGKSLSSFFSPDILNKKGNFSKSMMNEKEIGNNSD